MAAKASKEELLKNLRNLADELGRSPKTSDVREMGEYSIGPYYREFDSWDTALSEAGLSDTSRYRISTDELLDELGRLAEVLGHTPSQNEMNDKGEYGATTYVSRFGSWNKALSKAGFSPNDSVDGARRSGSFHEDVSNTDLLDELRRLGAELGRAPYASDMRECGQYTVGLYQTRFGTWNNALEESGFSPNSKGEHCKVDTGDLLDEIHRLADKLNRPPTQDDMDEQGKHGAATYDIRFGSWNNALEEAGYETYDPTDPRIEIGELVDELIDLTTELGRPPTGPEMNELGEFSHEIYQRRFGSWNAALTSVGLPLHDSKGVPDEELFDEIARLTKELGEVPAPPDMGKHGRFSQSIYKNRFGSWTEAVRAAGFEPRGPRSGEDHPLWKGGHERYYGESWLKQRKERRDIDDYQCQHCQMTEQNHMEQYGEELHVHHITPFRVFGVENHEEANRLDNLVTLCRDCHYMYEGTNLRPDTRFE